MPERIQLRRTNGWRLPEGAMSVARGSRWGNPFTIDGAIEWGFASTRERARAVAVEFYRSWILFEDPADPDVFTTVTRGGKVDRRWVCEHLPELAGKTLACWCPQPSEGKPDICHGAVLLELANPEASR